MAIETAAAPSSGAPALSFPRDIFAALSPAPFLLAHLAPDSSPASKPPTRPNGRAPTEPRTPAINTGSLSHCQGSAVARVGDTAVVAGVRAELLRAADVPNPPRYEELLGGDSTTTTSSGNGYGDGDEDPPAWDDAHELQRLGLLVPNVELATGASPSVMPGQPPGAVAQALTARLLGLLHATRVVRGRDLRIVWEAPATGEEEGGGREVKAFWTLYVDVLFISLDGNALDAAWGAVVAALRDTLLPRAWWDQDQGLVLCSERREEARKLRLRGEPVVASFAVFEPGRRGGKGVRVLGLGGDGEQLTGGDEEQEKAWVLADPDAFEEANCQEVVSVVLDKSGDKSVLHGIEKSGGAVVGKDVLRGVVRLAEERWQVWDEAFNEGASKS
ncbi:Exosome complex component rrp43 [Neofusicoccum parvum]|nr:Exosome complex component rrp43 [Neofusicoccum parvum]